MTRPPACTPDPGMACIVADAFLASATGFFSQLPFGLNASAKAAYERRGELAAAATNLALSVEIYLKTLAIHAQKKPTKTHNLLELFNQLPQFTRESIESAYEAFQSATPHESVDAIELSITTTPHPPSDEEVEILMERRVKIRDVRTLLLAEKDAFENWRYVYEPDLPTGIAIISVEFRRMSALARILKEHIVGAAPA